MCGCHWESRAILVCLRSAAGREGLEGFGKGLLHPYGSLGSWGGCRVLLWVIWGDLER